MSNSLILAGFKWILLFFFGPFSITSAHCLDFNLLQDERLYTVRLWHGLQMVPGTWRNGNSLMMSHGGTEARINFGLGDFTDIEGIQYRNIFIRCSMNKTINVYIYIYIHILYFIRYIKKYFWISYIYIIYFYLFHINYLYLLFVYIIYVLHSYM